MSKTSSTSSKTPTTIHTAVHTTSEQIQKVAHLAQLPLSDVDVKNLAHAFDQTLTTIDNLKECDTDGVEPTHQVTGLENVWRQDSVDQTRMFTQSQALANAAHTHDGFFVIYKKLLDKTV